MKTQKTCITLTTAALLCVAGPSFAQEASVSASPDSWSADASAPDVAAPESEKAHQHLFELGVFGGALFPLEDQSLRSHSEGDDVDPDLDLQQAALDVGGRIGIYPLQYLGIEGEAAWIPTETEGGDSVNIAALRVQAIAQAPLKGFIPFITIGFGSFLTDAEVLSEDSDNTMNIGLGAKIPLNDTVNIRLDLRDNIALRQPSGLQLHFPEALLGLSAGFGGGPEPAPPPPPPPADTDGDGIIDADDRCPTEPAKTADGCPIPDTDGDGVLDDVDQCPNEPAQTENGCPDLDSDKDGIPLPADKCPAEPGIEPDGCPDLDPDKDGIPLPNDKCADQPETVNGFEDSDGCPDEVPEAVKEFSGIIEGIEFATGKADIRPGSRALLDRAAAVLVEYPDLRLEISGHTDSTGKAERNRELSNERALAVKAYLVSKGVAGERLKTRGAGADEPIASNQTRDGRQKNRRIEFAILK